MAISSSVASLVLTSVQHPSTHITTRSLTSSLIPQLTNATKQRKYKRHGCQLITFKTSPFQCNAELISDLPTATSAAYGALLLGGGLFAYARSGSKGSIFGGATGAALMGVAYYLLQSSETKELGEAIGFGAAFLFSCVFGIRLTATRKFMPSGLLLSLSVGALAVFLSAYMQAKA